MARLNNVALVSVAFGLLLSVSTDGLALPPNSGNRDRAAHTETNRTDDKRHTTTQPCPAVTVVIQQQPPKEAHRITAIIQQQSYNHWWNSPNAPEWALFFLTISYVIVTIGLFVMTKKAANAAQTSANVANETLILAKSALIETQQGGKISERSVNLAEKSLTVAQRAYLYVHIRIADFKEAPPKSLNFTIYNVGSTPATVTEISNRIEIYEHDVPTDPEYLAPESVVVLVGPDRGVGSRPINWAPELNVTADQWEKIATFKYHFCVFGFVTYRDIFDISHTTGFGYFNATPANMGKLDLVPINNTSYNYWK